MSSVSEIEEKLLELEKEVKKSRDNWSERERRYVVDLAMTVGNVAESGECI